MTGRQVQTIGYHTGCTGSDLFTIFYPEEWFGNQRVLGYGSMGLSEEFRRETGRKGVLGEWMIDTLNEIEVFQTWLQILRYSIYRKAQKI